MILVDSSVWIDYFRGTVSRETDLLDQLLGRQMLAIGDLMLAEVLQGFSADREFELAHRQLASLVRLDIVGADIAVKAARNYRALRARGITIRKTIDTLIATHCIENDLILLHSDRDFDAFAQHLGLQVVRC